MGFMTKTYTTLRLRDPESSSSHPITHRCSSTLISLTSIPFAAAPRASELLSSASREGMAVGVEQAVGITVCALSLSLLVVFDDLA
jgi:hypothetical protein